MRERKHDPSVRSALAERLRRQRAIIQQMKANLEEISREKQRLKTEIVSRPGAVIRCEKFGLDPWRWI